MRHLKRNAKLGRKGSHRNAMLSNMVCSLIQEKRITTTLAKAKAARPVAEKMVTLGKKGQIHHRRLASARLKQEDAVRTLFNEIAPGYSDRPGGYTRIIKLGERRGDATQLAILEWVEASGQADDAKEPSSTESSVAEDTTQAALVESQEAPAEIDSEAPAHETADKPEGDPEKKTS